MASGVPGPDGSDPTQAGNEPQQVQTGMTKMYTAQKAPGFEQMLEFWFPGQVTPQMVASFEQGVMQMISNSLKESQQMHQKVQEEIQRRIKEG
ncbi:MAG: hypothetical protein H7A41_00900 [Chlamydiales bacterium]|nr:hypothetical protein [Chlamydiia bacterium]MCP5503689.1 hypothetical protein [Chlamydiales bacterium]